MENLPKLNFGMYVRKSTESEDRQVQSISDQKNDLDKIIREKDLNIVKTFEESMSAKAPGRPEFNSLLEMVYSGKINAIIAWHTNRLFRNMKDAGELQYLLQSGKIKAIVTTQRVYYPEDNTLLLSVEAGMSTQFIVDLRNATNRGLRSKAESGWMPSRSPIGWVNNKITHQIDIDHEDNRFTLVRKMWDYMLTGNYSVPQVWKKSIQLGLRTRATSKSGGKYLSLSNCYRLFSDPFYYGFFRWNGQLWNGNHQAMVSKGEFDHVQTIIKKREQKPKYKENMFGYSGKIFCEECGCMYTPEHKKKVIKKTGMEKEYRLYRCTRRKTHINCSQRKYINQDSIDDQIIAEISTYSINEKIANWCIDVLNSQQEIIRHQRKSILESQQKEFYRIESELQNLARMLYRGQITDEFYTKEKIMLEEQKHILEVNINDSEATHDDLIDTTKQAFEFLTNAPKVLKNASQEDKKVIIGAIAQKITARDQKIHIIPHEWISLVRTLKENTEKTNTDVRTEKEPELQDISHFSSNFSLMGRLMYDIGTSLATSSTVRYVIPEISLYPDGSYNCYLPNLFRVEV